MKISERQKETVNKMKIERERERQKETVNETKETEGDSKRYTRRQ